ncbi:hypothetical protein BV25DRAFT_1842640 [Artomyces pyxidatus]|uniref:Uncharacterized protein n=1 Tax=Artomyces pyxidatus TaxID=48021 RepID=A0ACB8SI42_9AGAM|nr:hypothetical protein BV25DRAFT_1842640 [Artomyces pyxidatus]
MSLIRKFTTVIHSAQDDAHPKKISDVTVATAECGPNPGVIASSLNTGNSAVAMSLLKDVGEMTASVPYLKMVAGILLRIIEIKNDVNLYRDRWEDVMEDINRVAQVIHEVSAHCASMGYHGDADLPSNMQCLLNSLKKDLGAVEDILGRCRSCSKWTQFKLSLTRSEMLREIERCDRRLKNMVEACNTCLLLSIRGNQHVTDSHAHCGLVRQSTRLPARPQVFYGREEQIEAILASIFADLKNPARISVLGPGGIGKTALALTVLHHTMVQECFKEAIYFISCDACTSAAAILVEIAQTLKMNVGQNVPLDQQVMSYLSGTPICLLCLDNFETPWDQQYVESQMDVEALLACITALSNVTLIVTMRGIERPAETSWSNPLLPPLQPFNFDAAKQTFEQISVKWDKWADKLVNIVEGLPLAVTLLAHLAQSLSCQQLWQQWEQKHISSVERHKGYKLTSLESSIQLSIDGSRVKADAGALPLLSLLNIPDILQSALPLQQSSLAYITSENVLHTHPLIKYYCQMHHPPPNIHLKALRKYFIALALRDYKGVLSVFDDQLLELTNIGAIFSGYLNEKLAQSNDDTVGEGNAFNGLAHVAIEKYDYELAILYFEKALEKHKIARNCNKTEVADKYLLEALHINRADKNIKGEANCLFRLGTSMQDRMQYDKAMNYYQQALATFIRLHEFSQQIGVLSTIGRLYTCQDKYETAKTYFQNALEICDTVKDNVGRALNLDELGKVCQKLGDFEYAKYCHNEALDIHKQRNSISGQASSYHGLALLYKENNRIDNAVDCFEIAYRLHGAANQSGQTYLEVEPVDLDKAEIFLEEALQMSYSPEVKYRRKIWMGLGDLYRQRQDYSKAIDYYKRAVEEAKSQQSQAGEYNALYKLWELYTAQNQYAEAANYYRLDIANKLQIYYRSVPRATVEERDQLPRPLMRPGQLRNSGWYRKAGLRMEEEADQTREVWRTSESATGGTLTTDRAWEMDRRMPEKEAAARIAGKDIQGGGAGHMMITLERMKETSARSCWAARRALTLVGGICVLMSQVVTNDDKRGVGYIRVGDERDVDDGSRPPNAVRPERQSRRTREGDGKRQRSLQRPRIQSTWLAGLLGFDNTSIRRAVGGDGSGGGYSRMSLQRVDL